MAPPNLHTLLDFFKALGNESRLRIVGLVGQAERSVEEIAATLGLKEPTVSHHLAMLSSLGLVTMRRDRNTHFYALNRDALTAISKTLFTPENLSGLGDGLDPAAWETKVLQTYFAGGRLTELPASRRKRRVVLAHLVRRFEEGRSYPEKELNDVLRAFHDDVATIRREFIGYNMMTRENAVYRRMPEAGWRREA